MAAICYGFAKEINEVTTFGYMLTNASPDQYGVVISRANITFGVGSVIGMVLSGFVLMLGNVGALMILGLLIAGFIAFTTKYFDNSLDSIGINDIKDFTVSLSKFNIENVKETLSDTVKKADLGKVVEGTKYIFLKPKEVSKEKKKIPWSQVVEDTKVEFKVIWKIISHNPLHYGLIWGLILVLIFGFWDTFASSFLLDFLDKVQPGGSYILLAVIGVP